MLQKSQAMKGLGVLDFEVVRVVQRKPSDRSGVVELGRHVVCLIRIGQDNWLSS